MANVQPPDLTIQYKVLIKKTPSDLSNAFFSRTQVPHTKCFVSGPYVIVGVASEADREKHTALEANKNLSLLGFELVVSEANVPTDNSGLPTGLIFTDKDCRRSPRGDPDQK